MKHNLLAHTDLMHRFSLSTDSCVTLAVTNQQEAEAVPGKSQADLGLYKLKPPVLRGKDMPSLHMYNMIRVHCRNLVTVNDLWSFTQLASHHTSMQPYHLELIYRHGNKVRDITTNKESCHTIISTINFLILLQYSIYQVDIKSDLYYS